MSNINVGNFSYDTSKLSLNKNDALSGNYLPEESIRTEYWGDTEELTFEEFDDGSVLIKEGDTAMGWTTIDAIKSADESIETGNNYSGTADELKKFRELEAANNDKRYDNIKTVADASNINLKNFESIKDIDDEIKKIEGQINSDEDILNNNNPATSSQIDLDELEANKIKLDSLKAIRKNIFSDDELCKINGNKNVSDYTNSNATNQTTPTNGPVNRNGNAFGSANEYYAKQSSYNNEYSGNNSKY